MVDESDRVWVNIDNIRMTQGDHCIRITKLEQTHFTDDKIKEKAIIHLLAGVATIELIVIMVGQILS